jgi:predicted O-methyltransferase YrrM
MTTDLHQRFNPHNDQPMPFRIKGFTRQSLAALFGELGFTRGAEIGVAEGKFSLVLCQNIPNLQLYCVDLWDTYYRDAHKLKNREMQDWALEQAHEKLDPYHAVFLREPSMDAVRKFKDNSLDFVYIDGDHSFDFAMEDLIGWSRKVRPGGIVSGHDAYRFRGAGVVDAVSVYTHCHQIHNWFVCDEREVSFFWEKP